MQNTILNVYPTTSASTATTTSDLQHQLYLKMKPDLQAQVDDLELWDVLKAKFEKYLASAGPCRADAFCKCDHDDHQGDDPPPEGEKNAKRQKTVKSSKFARGSLNLNEPPRYLYNKDLFFMKNGNTKEKRYVLSLHKIHVIPFPEEDLEEKMNRWVKKEFKMFNEEARLMIQHWSDSWHNKMYKINHRKVRDDPEEFFSDHSIFEVVRVTTKQQYGLDFMEQIIVMKEKDKPSSFSEANFKYLNKNDIKDIVYDFQLGIERYQIKINLTTPTLIFPGIKEYNPFSIIDKPTTGLIYLNGKNEKRFMGLIEISKFCDATLEKVLKEVKMKIFETEFMKKASRKRDYKASKSSRADEKI
ncbi:hypothetical protein Tco_1301287 [Tanacetum coccineum]